MQVLAARGSELERAFSFGVVRQLFEPFLAQLPRRSGPSCSPARRRSRRRSSIPRTSPPSPRGRFVRDAPRALLADGERRRPPAAPARDRRPALVRTRPRCAGWRTSCRAWRGSVSARRRSPARRAGRGPRPHRAGRLRSAGHRASAGPLRHGHGASWCARPVRRRRRCPSPPAHEIRRQPAALARARQRGSPPRSAPTAANVPRLRELASRAGSRAVSVALPGFPPRRRGSRRPSRSSAMTPTRPGAALADLDEAGASEAAADLARVDVLRPQPPLGFVHPLIRAAVYEELTPLERGQRARARRAPPRRVRRGPEQVAAHLLLVSRPRPEADGASSRAAGSGARARSRGAAESAVAYLRRALAEPPSPRSAPTCCSSSAPPRRW